MEEPNASGEAGEDTKRGPGKDTPSPYTEKINGFLQENERTGQEGKKDGRGDKSAPQHNEALSESREREPDGLGN